MRTNIIAIILALTTIAYAAPVTIQDTYIGGNPTNSAYNGQDIIGSPSIFDVSSMTVDLDNQARRMSVSILTNYVDNIGAYGTQLGDLFLSTAGWKSTSSDTNAYKNDISSPGEWNYVVALDNHLGTNGTARLYAITDANVKMSWAPEGYVYRANQAVQAQNLETLTIISDGTWNVNAANNTLNLNIGFGTAFDTTNTLAFHWGMTCANDIIEGAVSFAAVPEPSTYLLIIICMAAVLFHYQFNPKFSYKKM